MQTSMQAMPIESTANLLNELRRRREQIYARKAVMCLDGSERPVWPVGLDADRGRALQRIMQSAASPAFRRIVETGFAYGMSASFLVEAAIEAYGLEAEVVSIDPFAATQWNSAGILHMDAAQERGVHRLITAESARALPELVASGRRFDAAFIDGDHRFEGVFVDIFYCRKLLSDGATIVVDDAWMPSIRKACDFFVSAELCALVDTSDIAYASKFITLRVTAKGDEREWDHFVSF